MIIDKATKHFMSRSDKPNENWTDQTNVFVIDDGTELAQNISNNYPYFDFVLDPQGNLIKITLTERPPEPTPEPTELELLRARVSKAERVSADSATASQELLELLIEMEVI